MLKKILITMLTFTAIVHALDLPIANKYSLELENGEFTVFKFPFKIKKTFSSGFLLAKDSKEIEKLKSEEESDFTIDPRTNEKIKKKKKIIQIKQGKKSITFLPKARGSFKIIVWGYEKYPLMFNITITDKLENNNSNSGYNYLYNFVDYSTKKKEAAKFESDPHEKIIVKLIRSIYNKKIPAGYESSRVAEKFRDDYFEYVLNFAYKGKLYTVQEWMIKNLTGKNVKLYEEQFSKENVYAVAFENDLLENNATTRMFLVKKSN